MTEEKPKEKKKRICDNCVNLLIGICQNYPNWEDREVHTCIQGGGEVLSYGFYKCTHFKAKSKDYTGQSQ